MNIVVKINEELLKNNSSTPDLTSMFLYFEHEGICFPSDDWIDNPAVVFGWWFYSLKQMLDGESGQGFSFMEGPFCLDATLSDGILELSSLKEKISWQVELKEFGLALIKGMNCASRIFHKMNMKEVSKEIESNMADLKFLLKE